MNLDQFEQVNQTLDRRVAALQVYESGGLPLVRMRERLEEATAALGTAMEQLRIAEAGLRSRDRELESATLKFQAERGRYLDLLESSQVGYLVTDPGGFIFEANRAATTLLGGSPEDFEGRSLGDLVYGPGPDHRDELGRLLRAGGRHEWETSLRRRDGEPVAAILTAVPVHDQDGEPVALRWVVREAAAGRVSDGLPRSFEGELWPRPGASTAPGDGMAPGALRLRDDAEPETNRLRALIDGIDAIVWEADPDGKVRYVSRRAEEMLGHPAERWLGESDSWQQIVHPDDREWAASHRRSCLQKGRDGELEFRVVATDGRVIWLRESVRVVRDGDGKVIALRGAIWNVSKRKKVERQLYSARRELAEQLADMTHLHELSRRLWATPELGPLLGEILAATTAIQGAEIGMVRLYDADRDELEVIASVGLSEEYLARYGRVPLDRVACGLAIERGESVVIEDMETDPIAAPYRADARLGGFRGNYMTILVSRGGELLGTIVACFREPHRPPERQVRLVDLFARQAADFVENAKLHRALSESDRRKDDVLTTLADELRTPLKAAMNAAQSLPAGGDFGSLVGRSRNHIIRQLETLARLVDDLDQGSSVVGGDVERGRGPRACE